MSGFTPVTNTSGSRLHLLTAVSPRKGAGCSPTGTVGRRLARQLASAGERVRVLAEPDQLHDWPAGTEVVEGSVTRPLEYTEVFDGVDAVFLAGAVPATVQELLDTARDAGVRRIVVLSSHGPEYEEAYPPETWFWLAIERAVERSGMAWTHIRPSAVTPLTTPRPRATAELRSTMRAHWVKCTRLSTSRRKRTISEIKFPQGELHSAPTTPIC
ncbi:SDR family oxidoreductase [Streptomyces sp. NPDC059851]|uniref:SDR family oxidoreductase n=1 Tax=Streptomyces sp. NPDC059851 TaxID=3346971 RepID=UPI003653C554